MRKRILYYLKIYFFLIFQVDNEFFVPHGYLSDEEEDKDEDEIFNPEKEKVGKISETWKGGGINIKPSDLF